MKIFELIFSNWEVVCILCGIVINLVALVYNFWRFCRSDKAQNATAWLEILNAARKLEEEAEGISGYNAAQKLEYVLTQLREFSEERGFAFDEKAVTEQVNADIAFTKAVNAVANQDETLS